MPPKPKYTRAEIVSAALSVVSEAGVDALTAKSLAKALHTSTTPIFTVFTSMQEVIDATKEAAMAPLRNTRTPPTRTRRPSSKSACRCSALPLTSRSSTA